MNEQIKLFQDKINHDLYFAIAKENLEIAIQADTEIEERTYTGGGFKRATGLGIQENELSHQERHFLEKKIHKAITVSVVFSMLAMEAVVNYYVVSNGISKNQIRPKKISPKKADLSSKYGIVKQNPLNDTIIKIIMVLEKSNQPYHLIKDIILQLQKILNHRNNLIHYKAYISSDEDEKDNSIKAFKDILNITAEQTQWEKHFNLPSLQEAKENIKNIENIINTLKSIDSKVDNSWITNNYWLT
ncbi:hypothetical protein H1P_670011 [Hyella patelloides LEGE 07179]|uniref:Uncharacterized protein n=1 Tax=Hyella patelloides LEGE 07179 TaxID=945734 RepID=A0A563W2Q1_9CYAN|nr:hypothetical protein [Hyella patelloides]VEP17989.1 hypothetical protein H1P_670011 [Hyella patelloides LEGE 07179]